MADPGQNITGMALDELETYNRGERMGAAKLNRAIRLINRNAASLQPAQQVVRTPSPTGITVQMFVIRVVKSDYLLCRTWDSEARGDSDIKVLKPWFLRKKPFHGTSSSTDRLGIRYIYEAADAAQQRTATRLSDSETEDQIVVPTYRAHSTSATLADKIFGIRGVIGGFDDDVFASAEDAEWMDMNLDARMWAKATT